MPAAMPRVMPIVNKNSAFGIFVYNHLRTKISKAKSKRYPNYYYTFIHSFAVQSHSTIGPIVTLILDSFSQSHHTAFSIMPIIDMQEKPAAYIKAKHRPWKACVHQKTPLSLLVDFLSRVTP